MIDIIEIKRAVKAGQLKTYVKDGKIYLQDDIGEVVEIGKLDPDAEVLDKIRAEIQKLRNCSCSCSDGIIDDVEEILDKYKAEGSDKE